MIRSRLESGGTNLFQEIKAKCVEAEGKEIKLLRLSIGQPSGPALLSARHAVAEAVMSDEESMHEYQDNGSPGVPDFAKQFVEANAGVRLHHEWLDFLPIPGIKPMLGLVPLSCGSAYFPIIVATTTKPGYPTPADWCGYLGGVDHYALPLGLQNMFRFSVRDVLETTDLIMMNYPHNPSGQIVTRAWLQELCQYCADNNIRLFNDAAYAILAHSRDSCTLTEVATNFQDLSWAEAFSTSKAIGNGTGWRIGAIVGSEDFVGDLKTIKGNTDSGFVAPMASGVLAAFLNDEEGIRQCREVYGRRLKLLIDVLTKCGMQLAVEPGAGFFTLWKTPNQAFGEHIENAKQFNFRMIERTGVVGVHFDPYIRYAVCGDVEAMADDVEAAFKEADVSYK